MVRALIIINFAIKIKGRGREIKKDKRIARIGIKR